MCPHESLPRSVRVFLRAHPKFLSRKAIAASNLLGALSCSIPSVSRQTSWVSEPPNLYRIVLLRKSIGSRFLDHTQAKAGARYRTAGDAFEYENEHHFIDHEHGFRENPSRMFSEVLRLVDL
jgi:hypothetical protein